VLTVSLLLSESDGSAVSASSTDEQASDRSKAVARARGILRNGTKGDKAIAKTLTKTLEKWSKPKRATILAKLENLEPSARSRQSLRDYLGSVEATLARKNA
jgi:hypothetical protein